MSEGVIESYIHLGGKIGVMVEVNCETDFVAKNDEFKEFSKNIAMHIAATNPLGVKGGGEGGTSPALGAGLNAVADALKSAGVADVPMPATPYRIWRALRDAGYTAAGKAHGN